MKIYILLLVCILAALVCQPLSAQVEGLRVVTADGPPFNQFTKLFYTSGTTLYICYARASTDVKSTITYTSISNAAAGVVTVSGGHGFDTNTAPTVTITGGTGSWAAFNGIYVATVVDANTFSIPINTSTFGAVAGPVVITTFAPRTSNQVWQVRKFVSDVSGNAVADLWAVGGFNNACSSRTTLSYQ